MMIYRKLMSAGGAGPGRWGFTASNTTLDGAPWSTVISLIRGIGSPTGTNVGNNTMWISDSGTKLYTQDSGNEDLYQFTLSTAYDISTATYASKTFSYSANTPASDAGIFMSTDGTKMWISDTAADEIDYYTLSTAYDISTASYNSTSTVVAAQDTSIGSCAVSPDGSTLLVSGGSGNVIMEFAFGTAYDMSSLSWTQESSWGTSDDYFIVNSDGTRTWSWSGNDTIQSDDYSTGWDVSTRTTGSTADLGSDYGIPTGVASDVLGMQWNSDGSVFWVATEPATGIDATAFKVECSTNYDITTGSWTEPPEWVDLGLTASQVRFVRFGDRGYKLFVLRDTGSNWTMSSFPLSTKYDVTTAGSVTDSSAFAETSAASSFCFSYDGTKLWVSASTTTYEYDLSTAWDVSTISYSTTSASFGFGNDTECFQISEDGSQMYYIDQNDGVGTIDLTTANTFSGGHTRNTPTETGLQSTEMFSAQFSPSGYRFLAWEKVSAAAGIQMNVWDLATPFDASTYQSVQTWSPNSYLFYEDDGQRSCLSERGNLGVIFIESMNRWVKIELS